MIDLLKSNSTLSVCLPFSIMAGLGAGGGGGGGAMTGAGYETIIGSDTG